MQLFFDILKVLIGVIIGAIAGFFIARKYMQKYLKQNPPIKEQTGRITLSPQTYRRPE